MYSKTADRVTSVAGLIVSGSLASEIDIEKLATGDRAQIIKLVAVIATALWGYFTSRKQKQTEDKEV